MAMADSNEERGQINPPDAIGTYLPHLEQSVKTIEKYAFIHSDAPFVSRTPLVGPLIAFAKNLLRRGLRWALPIAFGSQGEFNAAVANLLVEFTHRAALAPGDAPNAVKLDDVLKQLDVSNPRDRALFTAFGMLAREIALLHESARAANLSAAEMERTLAELKREIEIAKSTR